MRFKHYEGLRSFAIVARHGRITGAAEELNLTKGAVSHQIKALEGELGFDLFHRMPRGVRLTQKGQLLLHSARTAFDMLDRQIEALRDQARRSITLGLSTYLASRWLSPRLKDFIQHHPSIRLRIQPMVDLFDLERDGIDIAIRWGRGTWTDMRIEPLFHCPAFPVAAPQTAARIRQVGLAAGLSETMLLDDRDGSTAWAEWLELAGLPSRARRGTLTIPDPNVRVQAVVDDQGVAINDPLIAPELASGALVRLSDVALDDYGYHIALPPDALSNPDIGLLVAWLKAEAHERAHP
ncbi:MAG: LysR substrate-binding domain-containing protein [Pseudomonadota bacterium]